MSGWYATLIGMSRLVSSVVAENVHVLWEPATGRYVVTLNAGLEDETNIVVSGGVTVDDATFTRLEAVNPLSDAERVDALRRIDQALGRARIPGPRDASE